MSRILEFDVSRQRITQAKNCDFKHLVAGSKGYLKAKFNFSDAGNAWGGCVKAASFWLGDDEYPVVLDKDNCCDVPDEVTDARVFEISVTGMIIGEASNYTINTKKIKVIQGGIICLQLKNY